MIISLLKEYNGFTSEWILFPIRKFDLSSKGGAVSPFDQTSPSVDVVRGSVMDLRLIKQERSHWELMW